MSLPIVLSVKETYSVNDPTAFDRVGCFVIISHDPNAGRRGRYTVISVDYQTGQAEAIGLELPIGHARKVAKRHIQKFKPKTGKLHINKDCVDTWCGIKVSDRRLHEYYDESIPLADYCKKCLILSRKIS